MVSVLITTTTKKKAFDFLIFPSSWVFPSGDLKKYKKQQKKIFNATELTNICYFKE